MVFVQMDQQTIADYPVGGAATTPTFRYVYASYIDEPVVRKTAGTGGTLVYFHRNHQYSVTAITTAAGAIAERYAYTAYGLPTILNASATIIASSAISNRYTYTGREWDTTLGLHHFRARWMSPIAGRFLGRDPIGYAGNQDNLYELFTSSPQNKVDPSGWDDVTPLTPGGTVWVLCRTERVAGIFRHCQLSGTCVPGWRPTPAGPEWQDCYPVGKSRDCSRKLYNNDGSCPTTCCKATDVEIYNCLKEFPYNAGQSCPGDNCQANSGHRLAKCCLETPWVPSWYGFPSDGGDNPHCLVWGYETRYACNRGGCYSYQQKICLVRLPDDYYGKNHINCKSGHWEYQTKCFHGICVQDYVFVCDEGWVLPTGPEIIPIL